MATPLAVVLDEYVVDFSGWPPFLGSWLIPAVPFLLVIAGVGYAARRRFGASRQEVIQAVVVFLVVGFVQLTLICVFFRAEGMRLGWALR
jgi:hypothetical protein